MPKFSYTRKEIFSLDGHIAVELAPGIVFVVDALAIEWPQVLGENEVGISGTDMIIISGNFQYLFHNLREKRS